LLVILEGDLLLQLLLLLLSPKPVDPFPSQNPVAPLPHPPPLGTLCTTPFSSFPRKRPSQTSKKASETHKKQPKTELTKTLTY
jgi:hypothetical protein